jgi:uncharacterized protein
MAVATFLAGEAGLDLQYAPAEIRQETVVVAMRDGIRLATDLYLPPVEPAPAVAQRTPYGRALLAEMFVTLARCGYVAISQDCRGTGDSEPDHWDFSIFEPEDCVDFVEWVTQQDWYGGFLGSLGGSYVGWLQWCMAMHPAMSAIAPEVGGFAAPVPDTAPAAHMFVNAYARSVGKGDNVVGERSESVIVDLAEMERQMVEETLATGYFNEPMDARRPEDRRALYERYSSLPPAERADLLKRELGVRNFTYADAEKLSDLFGRQMLGYDYLYPGAREPDLFQQLQAPALVVSGWYDWGLGHTLGGWQRLMREAREPVRSRSRLFIGPNAHNMPGYEGTERVYRGGEILPLLVQWYEAVRADELDEWPVVTYYLMGANEWRTASAWPPPEARVRSLHLGPGGTLVAEPAPSEPDVYVYDPDDPTPTVGGSIVSYVYTPGSADVSEVQRRADVVTYTTEPLEHDLDVVGPLRLVLHASSSAIDTDFSARLSDVFPDGRAIQLQGVTLRARCRDPEAGPQPLEPGRVYRLEIDMWATANRFRAGHRLRLDVSSADFPRFERNANRGGEPGPPVPAEQRIYHDPDHPSHLVLSVLDG